MEFSLISIIAVIGVTQGLFISLNLILTKKNKFPSPQFLLGLIILFLSFHCIDSILTDTKLFYSFPHFFGLKDPFILLYGPLIFFYILSLVKPNFQFKKHHLLHLLPFIFFFIRIAPLYFQSAAYKQRLLDLMYSDYTAVRDLEINGLFNLHIFIYLILALAILFKSYLSRKDKVLFLERKDLKHLTIMMSIILVVFSLNMIRFWFSYSAETVLWVPFLVAILFLIIGYRSLQIEQVITTRPEPFLVNQISQFNLIIKQLDHEVLTNKLYCDPSLNLNNLAHKLDTNRQYLSSAINKIKGLSFSKYINKYRVEEAKKLLSSKNYQHFGLEKIAQDSGFNSLSTFQRAFKDIEGISPSKYRTK